MESKNFIYAPLWVKFVALVVLVLTLLSAVFLALDFVGEKGKEDWILMAMSLGQMAASGLVIALVVFFSERDVTVLGLQKRAEAFFFRTMPGALALIDHREPAFKPYLHLKRSGARELRANRKAARGKLLVSHKPGHIESYYVIRTDSFGVLMMRLQVNVGEVVASFYFPAASEAERDDLATQLDWAFGRLVTVSGYDADWYYSREAVDGNTYASIHLTQDYGEDFLENERKKLFVANDLAANVRGMLKECKIRGIPTLYTSA